MISFRGIALGLAREGADVVVNYRKDRDSAERTAAAIRALGCRGAAVGGDTSVRSDVERFVTAAADALDGIKLGEVKKAVAADTATEDQKKVQAADIRGDRRTLVADSAIPAAMAVIYLGLLAYFASIGGYKPVHIDSGTDLGTAES